MGTSYGADNVTNGLILSLDAGDKNSYPGSGTTWYDLCGNNDTTINGATYNSGGYFVLDGTNDYFQVTSNGTSDFGVQTFSIELWCYVVANNLSSIIQLFGVMILQNIHLHTMHNILEQQIEIIHHTIHYMVDQTMVEVLIQPLLFMMKYHTHQTSGHKWFGQWGKSKRKSNSSFVMV